MNETRIPNKRPGSQERQNDSASDPRAAFVLGDDWWDVFIGGGDDGGGDGEGDPRPRATEERGGRGGVSPSLSVSSHNSDADRLARSLLERRRRGIAGAVTLEANVWEFVKLHGLGHVGFLTLTVPVNLSFTSAIDRREAGRRWDNWRRKGLARIGALGWVRVVEPQRTGRIHFHCLLGFAEDIRTGVNFAEFKAGKYRSAGADLRRKWKTLREDLPAYGFGRHELLPIRATAGAVADYVGKYIAKGIGGEDHLDFPGRMRRVMYSQGWRAATIQWSWAEGAAKAWRGDVGEAAASVNLRESDCAETLGKRWAYYATKAREWGMLPEYFAGAVGTKKLRPIRRRVRMEQGELFAERGRHE